jgi:hypothetical protein
VALEVEPVSQDSPVELTAERAREMVIAALEDAGQQMLAHNLESGEWTLRGVDVSVKVAMSQVLIDVALGPEPKRVIQSALNSKAAKPMKFKMISGGAQFAPAPVSPTPRPTNGAGARSRAASDPIVQRMQEKFGAEIRTVIDQKDR